MTQTNSFDSDIFDIFTPIQNDDNSIINPDLEFINISDLNSKYIQKRNYLNNIDEIKLEEKIFVILEQIKLSEENILNALKKLQNNKRSTNRSEKDHCLAINRKGKRCQGYICKKSEYLCFAHRLIARKQNINSHLYQKKTPDTINSDFTTPKSLDNESIGDHGGFSFRSGSNQ